MPVSHQAWTRFAVRFGDLSLGERLIDAYKGLGLDHFATLNECPELLLPMQVIEIIDRRDQRVVRRDCLDAETARVLFETVTRTLADLDITAFERTWLTTLIATPPVP